jgi:hypothetical protein
MIMRGGLAVGREEQLQPMLEVGVVEGFRREVEGAVVLGGVEGFWSVG